jgi:phage protein D
VITQNVRKPVWSILYRGQNITRDVSPMMISIEYADALSEASGDARIVFEDRDRFWQRAPLPQRGDTLQIRIGYGDASDLDCGLFQIDEIELRGAPDVFHIRAIETHVTQALRTARSLSYENMTLPAIAAQVAARQSPPLKLIGAAQAANVVYQRVTQKNETDLVFLKRIASQHGYEFSIRGGNMVFHARAAIEAQAAAFTVSRTACSRFEFRAKTLATYKSASLTHFDPHTKNLIQASAQSGSPSGDTLRLTTQRVENGQQAAARCAAQLHAKNMMQSTSSLEMPGEPRMIAGIVVAVSDFGGFDGNYVVREATHRISRDRGYSTSVELRSANG